MTRSFMVALAFVVCYARGAAQSVPSPVTSTGTPLAFARLSISQAESAAVAASPDVAAAQANVQATTAALAAVRASLGPALSADYALAPQGGANNATIQQRLTTVGVQTTVGELLLYSPLVAQAAAQHAAARAGADVAARTERVKAVGLYYDALKAQAVAYAQNSALELAEQQQTAARIRFASGDTPRLDILRANVAVAQARSGADLARVASQNANVALAVETAVPPTSLAGTVDGALPAGPTLDAARAIARALLVRPELVAARQDVAAAEAARRSALLAIFPALTLRAGYTKGVDSGVAVAGPSVTANLAIPLGGAAHARVAERDALVEEAKARQAQAQRQILLEVGAAARTLAAARRATESAARAREAALAELSATEFGYRNGASSSLELANARQTYTTVVVDYLSALYDEARARATLDVEIGA